MSWEIITSISTLTAWETAWSGALGAAGIFLPALLERPDMAIIAAWRNDQIIAGAIANHAAECVGISNVFVPSREAQEMRNGCIRNVRSAFGGLPLVGYASGSDLVEMRICGFEAVGALRVWGDAS